eukprot:Gb_21103 [translate_table: standard]
MIQDSSITNNYIMVPNQWVKLQKMTNSGLHVIYNKEKIVQEDPLKFTNKAEEKNASKHTPVKRELEQQEKESQQNKVSQRFQATGWVKIMARPVDMPYEPFEEEFKLCLRIGLVLCSLINKVQLGAVPKVVESHVPLLRPKEQPLSAYQYFNNKYGKFPSALDKGPLAIVLLCIDVIMTTARSPDMYRRRQSTIRMIWSLNLPACLFPDTSPPPIMP